MVMVMVTRVWVQTKGWEREPVYARGWRTIPWTWPCQATEVASQKEESLTCFDS
jgi:hypothetical protein